jgi:hypothetical protein
MEVSPDYDRLTAVLEAWSGLNVHVPRSVPSWGPAMLLVERAESLDQSARRRLTNVLEQSEKELSPLGEPLKLNFGSHRWLSADREESYSDWLAWILQGMSGSEILTLFSLSDKCGGQLSGPAEYVRRETWREQERTDVEVSFGIHGFLLVEVKVKDVGTEISGQLRRYANKLTGCHNLLLVLLGTEAPELDVKQCGFTFIRWDALCQRLRCLANRVKTFDVLRAAAILIFCGAAEQNLLGLSSEPRRLRSAVTADYLQNWRSSQE